MDGWDKGKVSQIVGIVLSALLALAAVYGYDVKVIQPREAAGAAAPLVLERGITNFNALAVDSLAATGEVSGGSAVFTGETRAGSLVVSGTGSLGEAAILSRQLIQGSTAVTVTAGLAITPTYSLYNLSAGGNVTMTLSVPAAPGQVLYLYGDDNQTITVNDTNILTTDGNAVTIGQYDIVEFMSVGSKWVHVAKSANS